jgi:hypothetical protein
MAAVHKRCDWAILLRDGYSVFKGNTHHTAQIYLNESIGDDGKFNASGRVGTPKGALITGARLERNGKISTSFFYGEAADLVVDLDVTAPIPVFSIELLLRQGDGTPLAFCPSGLAQNWHINGTPGKHRIRCQLPSLLLANGPYAIDLMLAVSGRYFVDEVLAALRFHIEPTAIGDMNWEFHQRTNQGCFYWDVKFAKESARMTDRMVEHKVSMVK